MAAWHNGCPCGDHGGDHGDRLGLHASQGSKCREDKDARAMRMQLTLIVDAGNLIDTTALERLSVQLPHSPSEVDGQAEQTAARSVNETEGIAGYVRDARLINVTPSMARVASAAGSHRRPTGERGVLSSGLRLPVIIAARGGRRGHSAASISL